jgi:uncharacterized protein (TIGR03118 family)
MRLSNVGSASLSMAIGASVIACLGGAPASAGQPTRFDVASLVSDGFVPAKTIDPDLINPWGISFGPTGPFWVSDNGTGVSTLYNGAGTKLGLTVTIPPASGSAPTGQVFNGTASDFKIGGTKPLFLFDSEDGRISGWAGSFGTTAQVAVDNSGRGAVYKGLAIGNDGVQNLLYAANFNSGQVEMYGGAFNLLGAFTDPTLAAGYAPFNVQTLGGHLFVTFALQDAAKHDDVGGAGNGYVDEFSLDGIFQRRIASLGGDINSPWGLALAPTAFGTFAGDLLVGNFGDGTISAYTLGGAPAFAGKLSDRFGNPIVEGDLWGLIAGNGGLGGSKDKIYFTAAIQDEAHGLFGSLTAVPEPASWMLMILGFGAVGLTLRRRAPGFAATN